MRVTVVIPVVELRQLAQQTLTDINAALKGKNLEGLSFLIVCSRNEDANTIAKIFEGATVPVRIEVKEGAGGNRLRQPGTETNTDYLFFNDCDDIADYEAIMAQARKIEYEPAENRNCVVCFNAFVCEKSGKRRLLFKNRKEGEIDNIVTLPKQLWGKLIPCGTVRDVEFPEMKFAQDWFPSVEMWLKTPHRFVDIPAYSYRENDQSLADPKEDTPCELMLTQCAVNERLSALKNKLSEKEHDYLAINLGDMLSTRLKRFALGREQEKLSLRRLTAQDMHTRLIYLRKKFGMS